ncbi:MAG: 2Fe-2S iron-sulfur cluster-binding protein [Acidiferrobacterales bacterium]
MNSGNNTLAASQRPHLQEAAPAGNVNRLPAPAGLLVDHDTPISFRFEGKEYAGLAGDTIASALAANDVWLLSRSFKYHRPRGAYSMAGLEANTLVQLEHEPNVYADRHRLTPGLEAWGQNYRGSLERDRDAWLDRFGRFLPVGFYYKTFYRPAGAWQRIWEPAVRRRAGLGRVRVDTPHAYYDKAYAFCDIAIVGGGPAGLSAALTAAKAGAEVLLIEQQPVLGGALAYARFDADGIRAAKLRSELVNAVESDDRIEVMTEAVCNGWFADNWLPVVRGNRLCKLRAREVVLATGAIAQPAVFHNNDLPGVMLGSAAQRFMRLYGVRPGKRAVVLTGDREGYGVALDLLDAGVDVAAIVDMRETPTACTLAAAARERGIRILAGSAVYEAHGADGHIRAVTVSRIIAQGRCEPTGEHIDCDLLCVSVGYMPAYQLALQAHAKLHYDDASARFTITELPPHLHLAGSVNGFHNADALLADGSHAGWAAARALRLNAGNEPPQAQHPARVGNNFAWPIFAHPRGKEFVDFDEDLQIEDIVNACADGYAELELVKRYATVGMGPSQGRHSALATARLVAQATGRTVAQTGVTTARPPVAGEKLGVLAGRGFEPQRCTSMHHRHLEAGAQMMTAGLWWRPAYYGDKAKRGQCIREEVLAVRRHVGLIDVSTLGGVEIRGPDAAEFLNRIYTFAYLKQPVGRARYVLMSNEAGTIIDDGVACRFHEQHFYVTATTGGADNVYRTMLWWNAQWRLDVDITNVTSAYAGINLAGPRSRDVLRPLCNDIDLSKEAFPYMAVRTGTIARIPARLIRIGFVGELGYEIHVPASFGEALWDVLLEAGEQYNIMPFGIEAQRVLRLEKGHIIIGQDTDAITYPHEADLAWAIARRKPFFVGARSIELRTRHPSKRKLVAFTIDDPSTPVPEESNLVLRGGDIIGHVTSVTRSPTLEKIIGLAFTAADEAQAGHPIRIKHTSGQVLEGRVATLPFYDPDNGRQEL